MSLYIPRIPSRLCPMGAAQVLPYDAEVEYLESTGTQYIDTGLCWNCNTDVIECEVTFLDEAQYGYAFGANETIDGSTSYFGARRYGSQAKWQVLGSASIFPPITLGAKNQIKFASAANGGGYINDTSTNATVSSSFVFSTYPIYILAVNNRASGASNIHNARLHKWKYYRNGVLIQDLIPVRVGNVGFMYDRVTGRRFGNAAGSGAFTVGPDEISSRYTRVEYLQSSGTQYILFDEAIDGFDGWLLPESSRANVYGSVGSWNGGSRANGIGYNNLDGRGWVFKCATSSINQAVFSNDTDLSLRRVVVDGTSVTLGSNTYTMDAQWGYDGKFALFGSYKTSDGTVTCASCRIGETKLYAASILVHDLIPVRVGSDGCMYDRVTGRLFRNQGTGAFGVGRDIYPISARSYVQDGLIANWNGLENMGYGVHLTGERQWLDTLHGYVMNMNNRFITTASDFRFDTESGRVSNNEIIASIDSAFYTAYNQGDSTVESLFGDTVDSSTGSAQSGVADASSVFGKGHVSGNLSGVYLRSAEGVYVPTPKMTFDAGPGLWHYSVSVIKDGKLYGWFDGDEILPSTTPSAANVTGTRFCINRCNAYRAIRVYNRALTQEEIAINRSVDAALFNLPS